MTASPRPQARPILRYLFSIVLLAVVYHLAVRVGLLVAYVQPNTSPVWPPTGIALAALLLFGYRLWPGISLGVFVGSLLTHAPAPLAAGLAVANTLEALVGAYCLRRFVGFHNTIDRVQDTTGLLGFAALGAATSASLGSLTLLLLGLGAWSDLPSIWLTWWLGNLLGALVVAPLILVWLSPPLPRLTRRVAIEALALAVLLAGVTWYVFSNQPPTGVFHQAMIYVIFPFVFWAALRLGQRGSTAAVVIVSAIAIWGTAHGRGPFSVESKNDSLLLLQTFMGVVSLTALILAAAIAERRRAAAALRQRVEDLAALSESSKTFLDSSDVALTYHTVCSLAVSRLQVDAAWVETSDPQTRRSRPLAACGASPDALTEMQMPWEARAGTPDAEGVAAASLAEGESPLARGGDYRAYAAFPLTSSGQPIGILKLFSRQPNAFSGERRTLIRSYANLAAVAIQNTRLLEEVRASNRQLHALSHRLMTAQEAERLNLSRELHDESGQLLAALSVQLGLVERDSGNPQALGGRLAELKHAAGQIQENLHRLAVNLRPASLDHLGLVTALRQYVEEFRRQYGLRVEFEAIGMDDRRLPLEVETALFRIVQESLTNVALHARATRVDVLVSRRSDRAVAIIEDDGVGFAPASPTVESHLGLFGMRERIEMLGGALTIESSPGKGTTVNVEVPCGD
jgi:signal transduction histidine kinase